DAALDLLSDAVIHPIFPNDEIERGRAELVRQVLQSRQNAAGLAEDHLWAVAYPGHPYGRPVHGTLESLPNLRRLQIQQFHRDWWRPNRARLVVAGGGGPPRRVPRGGAEGGAGGGG